MSVCVMCKNEILNTEYLVKGYPAVCSWVPLGAGKSIYAIISAHIRCMGTLQLKQAIDSMSNEFYYGRHPEVFYVIEKQLSELLANPNKKMDIKEFGPTRFSLLEID